MSVGRAKRAKPPRSRGTSGASDGRKSVGDDFGLFDHDVFDGNVAVEAAGRGADLGDFVDDVFTGHDAAEDGITPALARRSRMVEEVVVGDVDEELGRGGVGAVNNVSSNKKSEK